MGTVFAYTVRESLRRLMGIIVVSVSLLVALVIPLFFLQFRRAADGSLELYQNQAFGWEPVATGVLWIYDNLFRATAGLWFFLGVFACAPLLTSYLEKGWAELLFSKGVTRAQILLGRYLGAFATFFVVAAALNLPPALYLWMRAGVAPGRFLVSLSLLLFSFATLLALMVLVATIYPHPAMPIMAGFLQIFFSVLLAGRDFRLFDVVKWPWAQAAITWVYRILPKQRELEEIGLKFIRTGQIENWWPIWSSALFLFAALAVSILILRRRHL
jgi:ABC-type transport system involved in multi-copper enzyme maturation permease subunit